MGESSLQPAPTPPLHFPAPRRALLGFRTSPPPRCPDDSPRERWDTLPAALRGAAREFPFGAGGFPLAPLSRDLLSAGVLLTFDFAVEQAVETFGLALESDPACYLCHWGMALARGPTLNRVPNAEGSPGQFFGQADLAAAREAAVAAQALAAAVAAGGGPAPGEADLALLGAMAARYDTGASFGPGREAAEAAFRDGLVAAARLAGPGPTGATLLAAAAHSELLAVSWDYFSVDGSATEPRAPRPETVRALGLLDRALAWAPRHPLALHLTTHVWEMAGDAEGRRAGVPAADALAAAGGFGMGHLQHMPSHAYLRVGRWRDAAAVNEAAHRLDLEAARRCRAPYAPEHNLHMAAYASSMAGDFGAAARWTAAKEGAGAAGLPAGTVAAGTDCVLRAMLYARHGRWGDVDAGLLPAGDGCRGLGPRHGGAEMAEVAWRWARVLRRAHAGGGAGAEFDALLSAVARVPADVATRPGRGFGIYSGKHVAVAGVLERVARAALSVGGVAGFGGVDAAGELREAVRIEDGIGYFEPPALLQPSRQCLGAVLLAGGDVGGAEEAWGDDLWRHPENAWSLLGMSLAAGRRGDDGARREWRGRAERAWAGDAGELRSPCPALPLDWDD